MKSGVYFVHYDDIDAFLKHIEKDGRELDGNIEELKNSYWKDKYRVFSIDKGNSKRVGYWYAYNLDKMESWHHWNYTDEYIEHWRPNKKKVIL